MFKKEILGVFVFFLAEFTFRKVGKSYLSRRFCSYWANY